MSEEGDRPSDPGRWLPPTPPGTPQAPSGAPGPESGPPPPQPQPPAYQPQPPQRQPPPGAYGQPAGGHPPGAWGTPPPGTPPSGYGPPQGWQQQGQWQQQPGWAPAAPEPGNGPATTGFALSITAAGLLVMSLGILSIVTLPLAIGGWVAGRNGRQKVERGETRKDAGLAQAAVVIGMITTILSALALIALIAIAAADPEWLDE
jgi:hypothetical protein